MGDGVVAFAFGRPSTIFANRKIAEIASKKALVLRAPVFTQDDVVTEIGIPVTRIPDMDGKPPPTLRIAREAVRWARKNGIHSLWVVAADAAGRSHLNRCIRDLRYAIREAGERITVWICVEIDDVGSAAWFCLDSTQPRTQTKQAWVRRERIVMALPMWLYKFVAG